MVAAKFNVGNTKLLWLCCIWEKLFCGGQLVTLTESLSSCHILIHEYFFSISCEPCLDNAFSLQLPCRSFHFCFEFYSLQLVLQEMATLNILILFLKIGSRLFKITPLLPAYGNLRQIFWHHFEHHGAE